MLDHDVTLASFSLFNFSHHGTLQQRDGRHKRRREGTTRRDAKGEWTTNMKDDVQGDDADDMKDDAKGDNADDMKAAWMGDVSGSLSFIYIETNPTTPLLCYSSSKCMFDS